jgi:hypothetical protein
MGNGRMEHARPKIQPTIGDIVICLDPARSKFSNHPQRFVGLVLDKSITVCKVQILKSGKVVYWPVDAMFLWKEGIR